MPLVNPRQQLIESRQEGRKPLCVPTFSFAGVVVGYESRCLFHVVPSGPADHERRIADGLALWVTDPAFLGHVELAPQPPEISLLKIGAGVLGRHSDRASELLTLLLLRLNFLPHGIQNLIHLIGWFAGKFFLP